MSDWVCVSLLLVALAVAVYAAWLARDDDERGER